MSSKSWTKVEQIFHTALDLSVEERNLYLQRECAGDADLFCEVESLLSSFEQNSEFLDEPVFELGLEALGGARQSKNLAGSTIGFYELQEKIGAGGMGEVYKAVDTRLNRRVALKFLSEELENDNAARRRLVKEAQAVAMLEHPNICAVHGIEQSDEHHFIVMQYVEGETLAECIARQNVTAEEFKSLARQIITAVAFAHSHGVIHRDLKPGNIMIAPDGQIKVLDFGLAKVIPHKQSPSREAADDASQLSQHGLIIGTVSYMSPEQLRGEKLDYQSDLFSVGIILYELLTRENPFKRPTQAETIAAVLSYEPPLKKSLPALSENLTNLIEKCLQKGKEKRFQSAAEMLVELDKADSPGIRAITSKLRRRFLLKIVLAAVILFAALAVIIFFTAKRPQRTLAVLPISFDNPQVEKEYLADGLTQSIIDKLSNLSGLKVKNESLVARYKGKAIEPQTVGRELGVDALYTGAIIKRGEALILATKLIRTSDGAVIDPAEHPIDEANLIVLPEEISARILSKVKANMTDDDENKLASKDTQSAEAKDLYMQGRFHLKQRKDGDDVGKAIEAFTKAKELDPNYSKAFAGLAEAYLLQSAPGVKNAIKPKKAAELARTMVNRALELDRTSCDTYNSLGLISFRYDWKWKEAEDYFLKAIECDPEFLPARFNLINVLKMQERYDEAMAEVEKIKELDPSSVSAEIQVALIYYRKKQYKQVDRILSELLERAGSDKRVKYVRAYQFLITGRFKDAIEILEPIYESDNEEDKVFAAAPLGFAYAKTGLSSDALKIIDDLGKFKENSYVPAQEKALIYVGLGDRNKVFENLNLSCAERFVSLPGWVNDPIVDEVKTDPRFAIIKECVNL